MWTYDSRELGGGGNEDLARRNLQAKDGDGHKGSHCEDLGGALRRVSKSLVVEENERDRNSKSSSKETVLKIWKKKKKRWIGLIEKV